MSSLRRLLEGFVLVANEFGIRCSGRDVQISQIRSLIVSSLKGSVNFVADSCGLTKGTVHEFSTPTVRPSKCSRTGLSLSVEQPPETLPADRENARSGVEDGSIGERDQGNVINGVNQPTEIVKVPELVDGSDAGSSVDASHYNDNHITYHQAGTPAKRLIRKQRERRVPSSPFSRAFGFAGLGVSLAWGTVEESVRRLAYGLPRNGLSPYLSEKNAERIAVTLCRMRGAALKVGQMLSIQDESLVPRPLLEALDIVRQGADVMPRNQLNHVLDAELGVDWPQRLVQFDYHPIAAASIGQVHKAITKDGLKVAVKIQYPGVSHSIQADIDNIKLLLSYTNLIPKGLYLDRAMKVAKEELSRECDYTLEATNQKKFRDFLSDLKGFNVPEVLDDLSTRRVLTTELVRGIPIDEVAELDQETRDYVGRKLLELTLTELFVFRFMQTDPNWSNFLYDQSSRRIHLIDFGACREYPKQFVDDYIQMVMACSERDRDLVMEMSRRLGFLTGEESDAMVDAHVQAGFLVGLPFSVAGSYNFGSTGRSMTQSVTSLARTMVRHRLTPPPDEAYSLHRKLSGAFLACIKLRSVVPCRHLLLRVYNNEKQ